eukprot:6070657-Pleurochrysis_carterae.AAC.5
MSRRFRSSTGTPSLSMRMMLEGRAETVAVKLRRSEATIARACVQPCETSALGRARGGVECMQQYVQCCASASHLLRSAVRCDGTLYRGSIRSR